MLTTPNENRLIVATKSINDFQQYIPIPPDANEETRLLLQSVNHLLERLSDKYDARTKEADSLAAGTIRMVVMADTRDRLSEADKNVKTALDLKSFLEEVLTDLKLATDAPVGLYVSLDAKGEIKGLLAPEMDITDAKALRSDNTFHQLLAAVQHSADILNHVGVKDENVPAILSNPMLIAPVRIADKTVGVFLMLAEDKTHIFSKDKEVMLEQLMPDVSRVLERLDLKDRLEANAEEVRQTMSFLEISHEKLKKSFIASIGVFSNLMEMRQSKLVGHARRVADLSRALAQHMEMNDAEVQNVFIAALLHDVGKMGLPDYLLEKPFSSMTSEERMEVIKHPVRGESALMSLEELHGALKYIRGHHERFDGLGYPDKLQGLTIPLGARILTLANDYDAAQLGTLFNKRMTQSEAQTFIQEGRGNRYDPAVVDAFLVKMAKQVNEAATSMSEIMLASGKLQAGMTLSRSMKSNDGNLLLSKGYVLSAQVIKRIKKFEQIEKKMFSIWVYASK